MGDNSKIEWLGKRGATWNPVTGCTPCSPGCDHCWARRMANRLRGRCGYPADEPFRVTVHGQVIDKPRLWVRPRLVFVCSMGDLFHADVAYEAIENVFRTMQLANQHFYLVLTKRPERMRDFLRWKDRQRMYECHWSGGHGNIGLGVTVCNQAEADEKIPVLLSIPAAMRFVSIEPMLGPVVLEDYDPELGKPHLRRKYLRKGLGVHDENGKVLIPCEAGIDWVIVGGESGTSAARPCHPDWVRGVRDQCVAAGVPFFFKQWGEWVPQGAACGGPVLASLKVGTSKYRLSGNGRQWPGLHEESFNGRGFSWFAVGKKAAGRLLDGREWNEVPECLKKFF